MSVHEGGGGLKILDTTHIRIDLHMSVHEGGGGGLKMLDTTHIRIDLHMSVHEGGGGGGAKDVRHNTYKK